MVCRDSRLHHADWLGGIVTPDVIMMKGFLLEAGRSNPLPLQVVGWKAFEAASIARTLAIRS